MEAIFGVGGGEDTCCVGFLLNSILYSHVLADNNMMMQCILYFAILFHVSNELLCPP